MIKYKIGDSVKIKNGGTAIITHFKDGYMFMTDSDGNITKAKCNDDESYPRFIEELYNDYSLYDTIGDYYYTGDYELPIKNFALNIYNDVLAGDEKNKFIAEIAATRGMVFLYKYIRSAMADAISPKKLKELIQIAKSDFHYNI